MEEGLNIGLMLNGATLLSVLGLAAKFYLANKPQKIEQPLEVSSRPALAAERSLEAHMADNRSDHSNLFSRISESEKRIAALEAYQKSQSQQLNKIEHKIDRVLETIK